MSGVTAEQIDNADPKNLTAPAPEPEQILRKIRKKFGDV